MLAQLSGIVDFIDLESCIINVNGVGYHVYCGYSLLSKLSLHQEIKLAIKTIVKEDDISLYGFNNVAEKQIFSLLITVQGVGAKIALLLIGKFSAVELYNHIFAGNVEAFKSVSGIGVKVASRIVNELKDKIIKLNLQDVPQLKSDSQLLNTQEEAKQILMNLGYTSSDVQKVFTQLTDEINNDDSVEDIVKKSLKYIGQSL